MASMSASPSPAQVALAATGPVSLAAGREVARIGGNAVDVALAAAIAAMSTEPGIVSLGSGAFISIWAPGEDPIVIDGNVEMPGRGLPRERFGEGVVAVTTDYGGGVTMYAGHGSVATPGAVPACQLASDERGLVPWAEVVRPAAAACRTGYPIGVASQIYLAFTAHSLYGLDPEAHVLVTRDDGTPVQAGDVRTNPQLAEVLDLIGREGASVLTIGEIGRALVADMAAHGGLITARDLAEYDPAVRVPVRRQVGDWDLAINPPPSVGGPMLAVMLGELAVRAGANGGRDRGRGAHGGGSAAYETLMPGAVSEWRDIIDVQRAVLAYRLAVHDLAEDLDAQGHELLLSVDRHGLAGLPTSASTANISAVDSDGLACTITVSSGYGAGITIPGTGLILNNALGEPELNRLGLHALRPGTRLASNMAPTTGRTADGRVLAIGSPGADRITTALMQVLLQGCIHGADLRHAIEAPRVHVSFDDVGAPRVEYEADPGIEAAIAELGMDSRDHGALSMYFGGVGAAYRAIDATLQAAGDPRRTAAVEVFTR